MNERWFLFYDGACPLCVKTQNKIHNLIPNVKITVVDLNGQIAKQKGYSCKQVVLETPNNIFYGIDAWVHILSNTIYKMITYSVFKPILFLIYWFISKNRKLISKIVK